MSWIGDPPPSYPGSHPWGPSPNVTPTTFVWDSGSDRQQIARHAKRINELEQQVALLMDLQRQTQEELRRLKKKSKKKD